MAAVWDVVSPRVAKAARAAHERLTKLGIHHAFIGGFAVCAHGAPRNTKDVDFLVLEKEAFEGQKLLSFRAGVPFDVDGVAVDYLTPEGNQHERLVREALLHALPTEETGMLVVSLPVLVVLKLQAGRRQDIEDVSRLLQNALVETDVVIYVKKNAPELLRALQHALQI